MNNIIIFPTDTVYGIGASITNKEDILKIYEIKKRDLNKKMSCLVSNINEIKKLTVLDSKTIKLIKKYLPGEVTFILKSSLYTQNLISYETLGIRIPKNKLARKILNENGPMLVTSVNESEKDPLNDYNKIYNIYHKHVKYIYKDKFKSSNISSTVVDLTNGIKLIRQGNVSFEKILNDYKKICL